MEFGRVDPREIRELDFSLAPDGKSVERTLPGVPAEGGCKFYVGCSKWGRNEWKGHLYREKAKERDFLKEYAKHFDTIELNATFFSIPNREQMEKWRMAVEEAGNPDFLFVPKVSRQISHISRLQECGLMLGMYLGAMKGFEKHLGPLFLQMSDNFGPKHYSTLENFVRELPEGFQYFFELRHPDWFADPIQRERLFTLLAKYNVGTSVSDSSGRRDCLHMELPTKELLLRFVGNGGEFTDTDYARVDEWVDRIAQWVDRGLEKVYFFAHRHDESDTPQLAGYIIDKLNRRFGAGLKRIDWKA